jgi:MFS family permease
MLASLVNMSFLIFGFYSWQRYFLDLLGRELVWVSGVIAALTALSTIAGNAVVGRLAAVGPRRAGILTLTVVVQVAVIVAAGALGLGVGGGAWRFYAVVSLYLVYGVALGVAMPVKQAYVNDHIPSAQRATIISLDSFFANLGGVAGQSGWGYLARTRSIAEAWMYAGAALLVGVPLYWMAGRNEQVTARRTEA